MKKIVLLLLIYFLSQCVGIPFTQKPEYLMLIGMTLTLIYLVIRKEIILKREEYAPISGIFMGRTLLAGISMILLIDFLAQYLTFMPDILEDTFTEMQSGIVGVICIALIGPIFEEIFFRGAIERHLLKSHSPRTAILLSGLVFGLIHINPAQVIPAILSGFFLGWLYYRSGSLLPCILVHVLNNSLSVYTMTYFPAVNNIKELMNNNLAYYILLALAAVQLVMYVLSTQEMKFRNIR